MPPLIKNVEAQKGRSSRAMKLKSVEAQAFSSLP
jgi:hypothetical protein